MISARAAGQPGHLGLPRPRGDDRVDRGEQDGLLTLAANSSSSAMSTASRSTITRVRRLTARMVATSSMRARAAAAAVSEASRRRLRAGLVDDVEQGLGDPGKRVKPASMASGGSRARRPERRAHNRPIRTWRSERSGTSRRRRTPADRVEDLDQVAGAKGSTMIHVPVRCERLAECPPPQRVAHVVDAVERRRRVVTVQLNVSMRLAASNSRGGRAGAGARLHASSIDPPW